MANRNLSEKKIEFGHVRSIPKNVEESRTIDFVISDSSKDRHGTVVGIKGWELDAYNRNGIVGYMHNVYGGGMCDGPDPDSVIGKGIASIDRDLLIGRTTFEPKEINPTAEKIFRKVLFGTLKSTSVGFSELEPGFFGQGEEAAGRTNETYYFGKRELLEYSIVNIPSNRNAQKRNMRDQTAGALAYVRQQLDGKFRLSQIENMRVCDVLSLLDGKDIEIRSNDPDKVRSLLLENEALKAQLDRFKRFMKLNN